MDDWQPIATAPKYLRILGCAWNGDPRLYAPRMMVWSTYHPNAAGKPCWRDAETCGDKMRPTHWMPLPNPPGWGCVNGRDNEELPAGEQGGSDGE